ncbi:F-box protein At2g27310-like [Cynara cardunculus var. scolymus]|uniref:F-box domain, cyclin-like protein n=1 Tax=Cynara cardunculus var. scolymus TaxID=59895 RepID=A0A118K421_CYNCS|nr:F-box protein At2g27310-like [Cynara cardunculus var. scolymus]KVI06840.1 F-box domain, cyclin-like protein [Cynara cardunculus var. scolymus]
MSTTTLHDIHPHIIQTHILPRLDGPSLSTVAAASSFLQALCSDDHLWAHVSNATWPSITHPRVQRLISTFPAGYRSFFDDSFPVLVTHRNRRRTWSKSKPDCYLHLSSRHPCPSELISAVDIRYKDNVIFSRVEFTNTTNDFLSPAFRIELNNKQENFQSINLKVDELAGADQETLSHLKESVTLNWILIDPTLKRAGNLSSIKAVSARQDWMTNETLLRYVTVLPGREPNEVVQCRIQVVLGAGEGGVGLHVKEVTLKLQDLDCSCLNGRDFLVITQGVLLGEDEVKRKVVGDGEVRKMYMEFKQMKRQRSEWMKKEEEKMEFAIKLNYVLMLVSFLFSVYFLSLLVT